MGADGGFEGVGVGVDILHFFAAECTQPGPARRAGHDRVVRQDDLPLAAGRVAHELRQGDARHATLELAHDVDAALKRGPHVRAARTGSIWRR